MPNSNGAIPPSLINECLKGLIFESWLRFQFLEDFEDTVILKIPQAWQKELEKLAPPLQKISLALNEKPVSLENSRKAIIDYIETILQVNDARNITSKNILETKELAEKLENYYAWLGKNEGNLPKMEFPAWLKTFNNACTPA